MLEYYRTWDSRSCMKRLKDFFSGPLNKDYLQAAENMIRDRLYSFPPFGVFPYKNSIDWYGDASTQRSFLRLLHGHFILNDLIKAYRQTKDLHYLHTGYEMIQDWILKNPFDNPANPMAWHDETTARRLINWIAFFDTARTSLPDQTLGYWFNHVKDHADRLNTPGFYVQNTNHGMFQDQALIVFGDYFSSLKGSRALKDLARSRLKNYFNVILSSEGVHLEHSPGYHELIARKLLTYGSYFKQQNDSLGEFFLEKYQQASQFATHIIKPDGLLPQIGDTQQVKPSSKLWREDPCYTYAISQGKKGSPPIENDIVFPEAGYAIFRENWTEKEQGTYVLFIAAYHTSYHKHGDDLSVWIYTRGGDVLIEAGPYGYNYQDSRTQYGYSSFAHNALLVDHRSLPRTDGKYSAVQVTDFKITPDKSWVTGINKRYHDVIHTRKLEYDKLNAQIKVTDKISSRVEHEYTLLWHLAPDIEALLSNPNQVILNRKNTPIMKIRVTGNPKCSISKVKGRRHPYLLGWTFKELGREEPIETLIFNFKGKSALINTEFIFSK